MKQRLSAHLPPSIPSRGALALALGASLALAARAGAQTPPPPPVPNPNATPLFAAPSPTPTAIGVPPAGLTPSPPPTPTPSPSPAPHGKHHKAAPQPSATAASPTPTPTSPAFATLDGTWEVQLQYTDRTFYSYFDLKQSSSGELSGRWRRDGKMYPLEGTYDGRNFKMVVKTPSGDYNISGYVEAASDMIGLVDDGKGKDPVPFTAEHRQPPARGLLRRGEGSGAEPAGGGGGGTGGSH